MRISLAGKVAIVTGVSGDGQVGQAVAKALAENGARLAICARKQSRMDFLSPAKAVRSTDLDRGHLCSGDRIAICEGSAPLLTNANT